MAIVVFWLGAEGRPACERFDDEALRAALGWAEARRREGCRHVCLSSEPEHHVGAAGVQAVEGGRLPNGDAYEFSKAHRGAGPRSDR